MSETTIGWRIKTLRKRRGLTQDQLAEQAGVTSQAVSKWENDISCPDISVLPQLAAIFGVTTDVLLGTAPFPEEEPQDDAAEAAPRRDGERKRENASWSIRFDGTIASAMFVILLGVGLLLREILKIDVGFWRLVLADGLLCLGLSGCRKAGGSAFSIGMMLLGLYLALYDFHVVHFNLGGLWFPILLVFWGVTMLVDHLFSGRKWKKRNWDGHTDKRRTQSFTSEAGRFCYRISFGEDKVRVSEATLRGGDINVSFGEAVIDLTGCESLAPDAVIHMDVSFGEAKLLVPRRFRVQKDGTAWFGQTGVHGASETDEQAPLLIVKTSVRFGEAAIQYVD